MDWMKEEQGQEGELRLSGPVNQDDCKPGKPRLGWFWFESGAGLGATTSHTTARR